MTLDTIKVFDKYGNEVKYLTQWDINVELKIPNFGYDIAPVCHFAGRHEKESKTVTSTLSDNTVTVMVPNIYLTDTKAIDMFVFLYDLDQDTGRTLYAIHLPINPKPKPETYEYSDNTEIIEISALKVRLEALIAQAEETIGTRIDALAADYQDKIQIIRNEIADDVSRLNDSIVTNNTNLNREITASREQLSANIELARTNLMGDISDARTSLSADILSALNRLLNGIQDGTPKGIFTNVTDLDGLESGIYFYHNAESADNGYVFYWDGENLSERLVYYAGIVVNNNTITYSMLTDGLKKQAVEKILSYTLTAANWDESAQEIDISESYEVTPHTKADIDLGVTAFNHLVDVGCMGIYVATNENDDNKLIAHVLGGIPTEDITIQLTLRETV